MQQWMRLAPALLWAVLFCLGLMCYEGSSLVYGVFSLAFSVLLVSGLRRPSTYVYLFFSMFMWIGFWLKFTLHAVFSYSYQESIGAFQPSGSALDAVLLISTVGCLGVLFARWLTHGLGFKSTLMMDTTRDDVVPGFYVKRRKILWPLFIGFIALMCMLNSLFGIFQTGLVPQRYLIWPLNAALSWLLSIGFALGLSTLLWWELKARKDINLLFHYPLLEGFLTSVSILSRSLYICHIVPLCVACWVNRQKHRLKWSAGCCALLWFFLSFQSVTFLRDYYYLGRTPVQMLETNASGDDWFFFGIQVPGVAKAALRPVLSLMVDRWIGIEGVMAVSAYPEKSFDLFKRGVFEKAVIGQASVYQTITQSEYGSIDTKRFAFATLPGPIALLFYSGSLILVFLGMLCLTFFMVFGETVVSFLTHNFLLCALFGMDVAYLVAQMGVASRLLVIHFSLVFVFCLILFFMIRKTNNKKERSSLHDNEALSV